MDVLFLIFFPLLIIFGAYFASTKLTQMHYAKEWIQNGRNDRDRGYARFITSYGWIQRYYDRGYYEVDKRNE